MMVNKVISLHVEFRAFEQLNAFYSYTKGRGSNSNLNMQALAVKTGSYSRLTERCECHMFSQMTL